jgi:DNA-binding NarL/FixJ family response regulator
VIRIAIVDDHHVVREGIGRLLAGEDGFEVVAQGEDGTDVEAIVAAAKPDVLVLDMSMRHMGGMEVLKALAVRPESPAVVVLSMQDDMAAVERSLALGAKGYVLKQAVSEELVAAVRAAHRGSIYLCSEVSSAFFGSSASSDSSPLEQLSPREREVAELIVEGLSTKQIAHQFSTSLKTVQKQRHAAMRKFDTPNTASFVRKCMEFGIHGSGQGNDLQ